MDNTTKGLLEILLTNEFTINTIVILMAIVVLAAVGICVRAFLENRPITLWRLTIGPRAESTNSQQTGMSSRATTQPHTPHPSGSVHSPGSLAAPWQTRERSRLTTYYLEEAIASQTIDIISLTMQVTLDNYGEDAFLDWLEEGKRIRILILSPYSMAAEVRSEEEGIDVKAKILEQIQRLGLIYNRAQHLQAANILRGTLEVRIHDGLPYFAYFKTEQSMCIGLYYAHIKGLQSETIFPEPDSEMFRKMEGHFQTIWKAQSPLLRNGNSICKISESEMYLRETTSAYVSN